MCRLEELRCREVIDMTTGERLGFIDDVEMDIETASVKALVIYGRPRLFGLLGRGEDDIVPCSAVKVIGKDVILIKRDERKCLTEYTNSVGKVENNSSENMLPQHLQ